MPDRRGAPVAVVTAIREEFRAVVRVARDVRWDRKPYARARIGCADVVIAATGDGVQNAGRGAASLCDFFRPAALVGVGLAGGLTSGLSACDVIVGTRVVEEAGEAPPPDTALLDRAVAAGARRATLLTGSVPVLSASRRRALASSLGAGEPAAADMESAAWARAAAGRDVPYVILRAISDTAEEDLPAYLADCVGGDGGIRRSAVAIRALRRPSSWAALARLRHRVSSGSRALALFLERFLADPL